MCDCPKTLKLYLFATRGFKPCFKLLPVSVAKF